MSESIVSIINIPQLKDNYSYLIKANNSNNAIIVDPAESNIILKYIEKNQLKLVAILLTHHHIDHTAGVKDILNYVTIPVYSPSAEIYGTTNVILHNDKINLEFITMKVITTPGHTLDHVVYYNKKNKILFSGDTLFRLGCGKIFEGSHRIMYESLKKIEELDNDTFVYCGHEYTLNNLKFLMSLFPNYADLKIEKEKINLQLSKNGTSIPFNLGHEKNINPFLSTKSSFYKHFKKKNNFTNLELFSHLRELKDNF